MENVYIDPSTKRKKELIENHVTEHEGIPMFTLIEFNIWGACNRTCAFCPVSIPEIYQNVHEGISVKNYSKVLEDIRNINYRETILFSAFSEPLLHLDLPELVQKTKLLLPKVRLEIVSNGDIIIKRPDKLDHLFECGLDTVNISVYDGDDAFEYFVNLIQDRHWFPEQVVLRRRYYKDRNYGMTISNRAGLINSNEYRSKDENSVNPVTLPLQHPCFYPFYQIVVDYDGSVLMCAHDWEKKFVAGNAFQEDIFAIWKSKKLNGARKMLLNYNRNFGPCRKCDVKGDVMGSANFEAFKKVR